MVYLHECDVLVQTICIRSTKVVRSQAFKRTSIGYCLDDANRVLLCVGKVEKEQIDIPVASGGVHLIATFTAQGKATLTIARQRKVLLISNADPNELVAWIRALKGGAPSSKAMLSRNPSAGASGSAGSPARPLSKRTPSSANVPSSPSFGSPTGAEKKLQNLSRSPAAPVGPPVVLSPSAMQKLSEEQQEVLKEALRGTSLFFTGGAGTGKSFLLREILRRLPSDTTFATARRPKRILCSAKPAAAQAAGRRSHMVLPNVTSMPPPACTAYASVRFGAAGPPPAHTHTIAQRTVAAYRNPTFACRAQPHPPTKQPTPQATTGIDCRVRHRRHAT